MNTELLSLYIVQKPYTLREATAEAEVVLGPSVFDLVKQNAMKKGDVLGVAQLAAVMGAKQTPSLIPLCHPVALSHVNAELFLKPEMYSIGIKVTARSTGQTGVEMEALTGAAIAGLTVYDMCKAASKDLVLANVRLISKSGGKSGTWSVTT